MIYPTDILSLESWILLITALALIRFYVKHKYQYLAKLNIPHDPPSLLMKLGNMTTFFDRKKTFFIDNEQKAKHGPIWGAYFGVTPSITIHDPEILRQIYIKEFSKFPERQNVLTKCNGKELNRGLNIAKGEDWKRIRSTMSPNFSTGKMKEMVELMEWCANHATEYLQRKCVKNDGVFDVKEMFSKLSLDIVCSVAFSTNVHSLDEGEEPEIVKNARKLFNADFLGPKVYLCIFVPFMEDLFEKMNWSLIHAKQLNYFKNIVTTVIEKHHGKNSQVKTRVDFLQLMLETEASEEKIAQGQQRGLTRTEIIGNALVLILAGYENTANTMGFLAYNFAQYPEYQRKVQEEVDAAIKRDGKLSHNNIHDMKFLDMCLNESLRLYIPILRNARICREETTINGFTIPKDMIVNIPMYGLAHDPEFWDEPFEFKPERMVDMNQIDTMLYQPFGAGPRNCVAMRFAMMEVKMSLCKILEKYTIVPCDNTPKPPLDLVFTVSVRPAVDLKLRVIPRE